MNSTFGETKIRWLEQTELKKILAHSGRYRLMFDLMYAYGLRRGEVGLLKKEDGDRDSIWITRLKRKVRGGLPFKHCLPLVKGLKGRLAKIDTEYLFTGYRGGLSGSAVAKIWENAVHKSGLYRYRKPPTAHCLRHSCAMTFFALPGRPPEECQSWLGHSALASTMIYYRVEATRLKAVADAIKL